MAECKLRLANGRQGVLCDKDGCVFWRVADHLGLAEPSDWSGCAVQHFELLDGGQELASWLLSAKTGRLVAGLHDRISGEAVVPPQPAWLRPL